MSSDINLIIPGLWLGSQSYFYDDLVSRGITRVLIIGGDTIMNCYAAKNNRDKNNRAKNNRDKKFLVLRIHIKDHENENILNCLNDAFNFIDNGINEGGILVHCAAGMSRSPAIVIAYLMSNNYGTMEDCFKIVKLQRSIIKPNPGFQKQLVLYEKILTGNLLN